MNNVIINSERDSIAIYFDALEFAAFKHRFQKRKGSQGIPYINHPIEVARLIVSKMSNPGAELLLAAILHDTLEDTDTSAEEIESRFGRKVLSLIEEVTDNMQLSSQRRKLLQIEHAKSLSSEARAIKIADKTCNIRDILLTRIRWSKKRKTDYINWALQVVHQIKSSHPALYTEFEKVIILAEENLETKFNLPAV